MQIPLSNAVFERIPLKVMICSFFMHAINPFLQIMCAPPVSTLCAQHKFINIASIE